MALLDMTAVNEPTIRKGWRVDYDGKKFFSRINQKIANVEAILMYTVGVAITNKLLQCKHCRQGNGPFEYCVQVPGFKECANCHWDKQGPRCSFNDNPQPPRKSRQNNKLSTQEKFVNLDAKMVAFKAQLAAVLAVVRTRWVGTPIFLENQATRSTTSCRGTAFISATNGCARLQKNLQSCGRSSRSIWRSTVR